MLLLFRGVGYRYPHMCKGLHSRVNAIRNHPCLQCITDFDITLLSVNVNILSQFLCNWLMFSGVAAC